MGVTLRHALAARDLETLLEALDPGVVWQGIDPSAVCRSREEVRQVYEAHLAAGRTGRPEIVADAGDRVVIDPRPEPPVEGIPELHHVFTIRDGRVVRMEDYPDRTSALAAVGLK